MSDIAIRAEDLGKRYRIGPRQRYKALRDTLTGAMYAPFRRIRAAFQQRQGDKGMGRQGARRVLSLSPLLPLSLSPLHPFSPSPCHPFTPSPLLPPLLVSISRIIRPTESWTEIHGRVGSLLEVEQAGQTIPEQIREAARLSDYAVEARYPGLAEPVTHEEYGRSGLHCGGCDTLG